MSKKFEKELPELINAGVITNDTANRIQEYYKQKNKQDNRLFVAFAILGSILIGLGIILIVAHNWDEFSRTVKTILAFLPLVLGHILCAGVLIKIPDNVAWKELSAAIVFFAVGEVISMVGQIYNLDGDWSTFLLTWSLLCVPLVYVLRSSITSLLYIVLITLRAANDGYSWDSHKSIYDFWLLLLLVLPHYYFIYKKRPDSNFTIFHHWFVPLSFTIVLGGLSEKNDELIIMAYLSLFSCFYLIGNTLVESQKTRNNGYLVIGSLATIGLLLSLTFEWYWKDVYRHFYRLNSSLFSQEFNVLAILTITAGILLYRKIKQTSLSAIIPFEITFAVLIFVFVVGTGSPIAAQLLVNLILLGSGIWIAKEGATKDHLGILNSGLLIIAVLVICRFFDSNISFVIRGLLFLAVGTLFFIMNNRMLKKRKQHED